MENCPKLCFFSLLLVSCFSSILYLLTLTAKSERYSTLYMQILKGSAKPKWHSVVFSHHDQDPSLSLRQDPEAVRSLLSKKGGNATILCWIGSIASWMNTRVKAVNETWLGRCDKHLIFVNDSKNKSLSRTFPDVVSLNGREGRNFLTAKTVGAFEYIYNHYPQYDWVVKADDDTFMIVENLRVLLANYNASDPMFFGHFFKMHGGYMSGGGGYVLSKSAVQMLVLLGKKEKQCNLASVIDEDVAIGMCLLKLGIYPQESRDKYGRESFHPEPAEEHIGLDNPIGWLKKWSHFPPKAGRNCCSELTISFHHLAPQKIRLLHHLLYRTTVFGLTPNFDRLHDLFKPGLVSGLPKRTTVGHVSKSSSVKKTSPNKPQSHTKNVPSQRGPTKVTKTRANLNVSQVISNVSNTVA